MKADADPFAVAPGSDDSEDDEAAEPLQGAMGFRQAQEYNAWFAWREEP